MTMLRIHLSPPSMLFKHSFKLVLSHGWRDSGDLIIIERKFVVYMCKEAIVYYYVMAVVIARAVRRQLS